MRPVSDKICHIVLLCLMFCAFDFAHGLGVQNVDELIKSGGFFRPEWLPVKPNNIERDAAASIELGSRCSSVVLSPDGYVATNIHCVVDCLVPSYDYDPQIDVKEFKIENLFSVTAINEQVPKRLNCKDIITIRFSIFDLPVGTPRIVWLGRGQRTYHSELVTHLTPHEVELIRDHTEDVAILKFDVLPGSPPLPCVPIGKTAQEGDLIWTIGYPVETHRGTGHDSNGRGQFASFGKVTDSIRSDPELNVEAAALTDSAERKVFWDRNMSIWDQPHLLQSNVDAFHRNSGGMMVDAEGNLQAILFSITKATDYAYLGNTVIGIRADHVELRSSVIWELPLPNRSLTARKNGSRHQLFSSQLGYNGFCIFDRSGICHIH